MGKSISDEDLFTLSFQCERNRAEEADSPRVPLKRKASNPLHNSAKLNRLYKSIEKPEVFRIEEDTYINSESNFPKLKRSQTVTPDMQIKRASESDAILIRTKGKRKTSAGELVDSGKKKKSISKSIPGIL